jgi:hypothetical protein
LGAIALSAGSYFYQNYLTGVLVGKKETLEKARKGFDIDTIKELKRLDTRIETAKGLLDKHIAISGVFDILQQATLKTISYSSFDITSAANSDAGDASGAAGEAGGIQFKMNGIAKSYNSVALQSDLLSKTKGIKEPIFSNINLNEAGNITFSVSALIDPGVLRYRAVNDLRAAIKQATPENTTASSTTDGTPTIPAPTNTTR